VTPHRRPDWASNWRRREPKAAHAMEGQLCDAVRGWDKQAKALELRGA
jgi:hypothetical protein